VHPNSKPFARLERELEGASSPLIEVSLVTFLKSLDLDELDLTRERDFGREVTL
jgi:hypothetical protein